MKSDPVMDCTDPNLAFLATSLNSATLFFLQEEEEEEERHNTFFKQLQESVVQQKYGFQICCPQSLLSK
jgi:hypothetical protein